MSATFLHRESTDSIYATYNVLVLTVESFRVKAFETFCTNLYTRFPLAKPVVLPRISANISAIYSSLSCQHLGLAVEDTLSLQSHVCHFYRLVLTANTLPLKSHWTSEILKKMLLCSCVCDAVTLFPAQCPIIC